MKGLLKFITCGSVDDGKSTLIGHILYDAKLLYADQEKALELDSKVGSRSGKIDYSLLLDGLMAEREQGITIDVAYRYFTTDNRSFIVADTPGHEEYTRNMAVGASFADLAVILIDASQGVLVQTRRHARICKLMGIRYFVFAVNKMDLVKYSESRFNEIVAQIDALKQELGLDSTYMPKPLPSYPYSPSRKVYIKEITFDGLDEKDKRWLLKRCDLKEDSEISIRRIEEATAILCSNLEYSSATYNLPEAPGGGYNLHFLLSKKYENKLNVGIRFDSEETASLLINVTSNFRGKVPTTLSLTGRLGKRYAARIDYGFEPAPLKNIGLAYMFQYNDINFYRYGDKSHNSTFRYHLGELSFSDVWYKNVRFAIGLRYELYDYDKFLYQEGNQGFDVGTEHFFSYFAQMHYETFDKAYFPTKGISARASYSLYTDNFTGYDGHAPFSAIKGYCQGVVPVTRRFSILPAIYGRFLIGKDIPYSKLNAMGGDVQGRFLQQQLPFVGINNVELMRNTLLIGSMKFRQRMGSVHYLTLTGNYALSASKLRYLLEQDTMFGCGIGYGLDSMFGPLEASLNYANRANKVSMYVNLGFKF